ncbi:spore germination protein [Paenibacillus sp. y28]|uniref:spore germination protein n=1 Tax=Paenibacillus sp. y28 TaxID=3129110 RepID=UPI003015A75C
MDSRNRKRDPERKQDRNSLFDRLVIEDYKSTPISSSLEENRRLLMAIYKDCSDMVLREFHIEDGPAAIMFYIDGIAKTDAVDMAMKALMILEGGEHFIEQLQKNTLPVTQMATLDNFGDLFMNVLSGDTGLLVEGNRVAASLGLRGAEHRGVSEPETESVIRGPREGFTEHLRTNTALIRQKIKSPRLKMKPLIVGRETNTSLVVTYIQGLADPKLIDEVVARIEQIKIDGVLESGYIEELIQDNGYSPFPQLQITERPDTVAASLLEGRVAILVDGTPFVMLAPIVFWQWLQASEDYYERFYLGTFLRFLRLLCLFLALLTPAIYIALSTYHQEMIPTNLLLSIAASREPIPFPAVVEAMIMELAFEALREAGIRLPKTVGQAVSILGALVVGQAAVQAGIVSAAMVIVVSITGIASFTLPRYNAAISVRLLRFPLMLAASLVGLLGIVIGVMLIIGHMARLRSFGVSYLSPVAPLSVTDFKDVAIRAPWWQMKTRPAFMDAADADRLGQQTEKLGQNGDAAENGTRNNSNSD